MEWINISIGTDIICTFQKTDALYEIWNDITTYVRLYGGKAIENNFTFEKRQNAYSFVKHFVREFFN